MPTVRNNQRRRRVVLDEVANSDLYPSDSATPVETNDDETTRSGPAYYDKARRRFQFRTTDLLPKRSFTLLAVISLFLSALFGMVLLDSHAPQWEPVIGPRGVEAFTINSSASLSAWFSSFILILTALGCLQVYCLRQHRCDDYRGQYRWWFWLALILVLASINCVAGIIPIAATAVGHLFKSTENFTTGWGWILIKLSVLTLLVGRFAYEMRQSRGALMGCFAVFVAYCGALVMQYSPPSPTVAESNPLTQGNFLLLAKIAIFSVVLIYGRFVYFEAHGLIQSKPSTGQPKRGSAITRWKTSWAARQAETTRRAEERKRKAETKREKKSAERLAAEEPEERQNRPAKTRAAKTKPTAAVTPRASRSTPAAKSTKKTKPAAESTHANRRKTKPRFSSIEERKRPSDRDVTEIDEEILRLESKSLNKAERRRLRKLQRRRQAA